MNLPSDLVVVRHRPLALEDVDLDLRLVVGRRGEDLALAGRDRRVALDQRSGHATQRLDREGQRRDVEEEDVLDLAAEHAALDRRADRDDLIRVDALVRLLAEEALYLALHGRHPGLATDQHRLVDLALDEPGILQRGFHRRTGPLDQRIDQLLELGAGQRDVEVLRTAGVGRDERQVDLGLLQCGELDLRLLGRFLQPLQGHPVLAQVDAFAAS